MKRIFLSGVVAGFAFFVWLSFIHMATPLAQVGIRAIPNEAEVVASIKNGIPNEGFYLFPGAVTAQNAPHAEKVAAMQAAMEKMKTSPTGILVVYPNGKAPLTPQQLIAEALNDIAQGLLLAWLLFHSSSKGIGEKVKFAMAVGLAASFLTNISYWNWYGFPTSYTLATIFGQVVGYMVMGLAIGIMSFEKPAVATGK
jgi:hypothetical protein